MQLPHVLDERLHRLQLAARGRELRLLPWHQTWHLRATLW
jgi:hypothetical protein